MYKYTYMPQVSWKKLEMPLYIFNTSRPVDHQLLSSSHGESKVYPKTFMTSNASFLAIEMHTYFASNFML
jgi:hypothetical protein